jgi:hypothetical protein
VNGVLDCARGVDAAYSVGGRIGPVPNGGAKLMDDKRWERIAALGGVAFVVLNIVGSIIQGAPPSSDSDSPAKIADWFVDNGDGIRVAVLLGGLAMIGLVWWFGSLWRRMAHAEGGNHRLSVVALAGLVAAGALASASFAVLSAIAMNIDDMDAADVRFFFMLSNVLLALSAPFIVAHLAAVNALSMRTGFLPRWITIIGIVASALFLVASGAAATDADGIMIFGFLGFIVWSLWILCVSVFMWRTTDAGAIEVVEVVEVSLT